MANKNYKKEFEKGMDKETAKFVMQCFITPWIEEAGDIEHISAEVRKGNIYVSINNQREFNISKIVRNAINAEVKPIEPPKPA